MTAVQIRIDTAYQSTFAVTVIGKTISRARKRDSKQDKETMTAAQTTTDTAYPSAFTVTAVGGVSAAVQTTTDTAHPSVFTVTAVGGAGATVRTTPATAYPTAFTVTAVGGVGVAVQTTSDTAYPSAFIVTVVGDAGATVQIRVSACRVKYLDPDGRLQREKNGVLIFLGTEMGESRHPADDSTATTQFGILFADNGTPIEASSNREVAKPGYDTDCHGVTFADGKYWINDDQVEKILVGDRYRNVNEPKIGDIAIFRDKARNEIVHSARVVEVKKEHSFLFFQWGKTTDIVVEGLGGLETEIHRDSVKDAWHYPSDVTYYRQD